MITFETHALPNGLRFITAPMHDTQAVTVLFLIGIGSRYETKFQSGLSHFLEHMVFKGTTKRPSNLIISTELDSVGAQYNAFTSEEQTGFFVRASFDQFPLALDVLNDLLWHSTFPATELEREKRVIVEEINMYHDDPQRQVVQLAQQLVFGNNPLGRSVAGSKATVTAFQKGDFIRYRDENYVPENVVVAIAGNPGPFRWSEEISKTLRGLKKRPLPNFEPFTSKQTKPGLALERRPTDQAHLIVASEKFARTDPRWPVVRVITTLLGAMMSSRLFVEVRERRGLAYYINASYDDFRDSGLFYIRAGVDTKKIDEAIRVILGEMSRLTSQPVPDQELLKTQENLKGNLYLSLEDSLSIAEFLADQAMFWGSIEQPEQIIDRIKKVTAHDIIKVARELFVTKKLNLAVVGPYSKEERFLKLLKL